MQESKMQQKVGKEGEGCNSHRISLMAFIVPSRAL